MRKLILAAVVISGLAFVSGKPYVIYKGNKYYRCRTYYTTDTLESPGSIFVRTSQTIYFDAIECQ